MLGAGQVKTHQPQSLPSKHGETHSWVVCGNGLGQAPSSQVHRGCGSMRRPRDTGQTPSQVVPLFRTQPSGQGVLWGILAPRQWPGGPPHPECLGASPPSFSDGSEGLPHDQTHPDLLQGKAHFHPSHSPLIQDTALARDSMGQSGSKLTFSFICSFILSFILYPFIQRTFAEHHRPCARHRPGSTQALKNPCPPGTLMDEDHRNKTHIQSVVGSWQMLRRKTRPGGHISAQCLAGASTGTLHVPSCEANAPAPPTPPRHTHTCWRQGPWSPETLLDSAQNPLPTHTDRQTDTHARTPPSGVLYTFLSQ